MVLLLGVVALVLVGWMGKPQSATEPGLITASGEAEMRIVPDEVILRLGVETSDKVLANAKRQNDAVIQRVLDIATRYDIPAEHVQTDYIHIEPRYNNGYTQREFVGYFVNNTVVITLRDLAQFEDVLSAALESGVNYVHSIEFRTTELRKYRDEARTLALQAAREKATAMAETLDQRLGAPRTIQEEANQWWAGYSSWWGTSSWSGMTQNVIQEIGGEYMGTDSSLAPGQISVKARVSVSFALLP